MCLLSLARGPANLDWVPRMSCTPMADHTWNMGFTFSLCAEDSHILTLRNHIILMRMQMKGKLWEMALDELLVKNVLLGRGCCKGAGEPSFLVCQVAFSGGLALGGTWPSLKEAHLHWCAYCYWFLFMVFKQLMQVLTAFPFSYLHKSFYFGKISEDQWSGTPWERSRFKAGLGVALTKPLRGWGPGKGAKNICHWDTRNSCGPGQINHSLGRSGYRGGRTARGDLPGKLCTLNLHYVHKWCLALCSLGLLFSMQ